MKKILLLILCITGAFIFPSEIKAQEVDSEFEDDDSIFDNAEDITAEENNLANADSESASMEADLLVIPFKFYGNLRSDLGLAFGKRFGDLYKIKGQREKYVSGYFDFENKVSFVSRIDESFTMHGTLCTTFFPVNWVNPGKSELYFDYMGGQNLIVSAGKKNLNWGYVRIFSNVDDFEDTKVRLTTNIVADSENSIIGSVTFPFSFVTATGVILYDLDNNIDFDNDDPPKVDQLSYAGSIEFTFLQASVNLYGRRSAADSSSITETNPYGINNVLGIEMKRTFFDYDIYLQNTLRVSGRDKLSVDDNIFTIGTYRLWDYFGFNVEVQNVCGIEKNDESTWRVALDMGWRRLGSDRDTKVVVQWRHDSNRYEKKGEWLDNCWVKFGVIKSRVMRHVDLHTGLQLYYRWDETPYVYDFKFASYFRLDVGY